MQMFNWSDDWGETQKLAFEHYEAKAATFREASFTPAEGVLDWLRLLKQYEVCLQPRANNAPEKKSRVALHELPI